MSLRRILRGTKTRNDYFLMLLLIGAIFLNGMTNLAYGGTKEDALAMLDKAITIYKEKGFETITKMILEKNAEVNDGKELYVFIYDDKGTMMAHPNSNLVGQNTYNSPDIKGKLFRKEIIDTAKSKGSGSVDYHYKNPKTNEIGEKTTYFKKIDDLVFCIGTYKSN